MFFSSRDNVAVLVIKTFVRLMSPHLVKLLKLAWWHQLMKFLFHFFAEKIQRRKFVPAPSASSDISLIAPHTPFCPPPHRTRAALPHGACNHKISASFCLEFHVNYKWIEWIKRMPNSDCDACVCVNQIESIVNNLLMTFRNIDKFIESNSGF